ncbi:hypothetical protein GCM10009647_082910 [Streptomyces sanglieri]
MAKRTGERAGEGLLNRLWAGKTAGTCRRKGRGGIRGRGQQHGFGAQAARVARNMTLEEAADALNAITGGATDASLMSAWESGRRRTGKRNRAGLCQLHRERPEVLFAHQDGAATSVLETSGTAVVVKVLTRWTDLVEAMVSVAAGARE